MNNIEGKTIKKVNKIDSKISYEGRDMKQTPAIVVIEFTDGTKCTITPDEKGNPFEGEHPYIDLTIS